MIRYFSTTLPPFGIALCVRVTQKEAVALDSTQPPRWPAQHRPPTSYASVPVRSGQFDSRVERGPPEVAVTSTT